MGSPLRLLAIIAGSIFAAELVVMIALEYLPPMRLPEEALLRALLLSVLLYPLIDLFHLRRLRRSHERLRKINTQLQLAETAFQESNEGMTITDKHNCILRINPAFTRITGYTEEEAVGQNPRLLSSGRHDRSFYVALWSKVKDTGSWSGEIWNRRKNGEVFPEWLSIRAIKNEAGETAYHMAIFSDITQRKHSEERMRYLANHDPLTGLPNRILFNDRLRQARELAVRDRNGFTLMFMDLDDFKPVNDNLGHGVGDRLLQEVAKRVVGCVRNIDTVARFGGDEFTVILQEVRKQEQSAAVAQKILNALSQPFQIDTHEVRVSASIGVAYWDGEHFNLREQSDLDDIVKQADEAMYQAKESGPGRYCLWEPPERTQAQA